MIFIFRTEKVFAATKLNYIPVILIRGLSFVKPQLIRDATFVFGQPLQPQCNHCKATSLY